MGLWLGGAGGLVSVSPAQAYPYGALRPADQVMAGPTDGHVSAIHWNPAALRLSSGSHILAVAGARGTLGSYGRDTPLPAGFDPGQVSAQPADPAALAWAVSDMMVAASWDLRTEAVTLGFGVYTPYNDGTRYAAQTEVDSARDSQALQRLSTRYHAIADQTYSLWGTVAAALRLRRGLFFGGGFQFAYTRSRMTLLRDLGDTSQPGGGDGLPCAGGRCEQWTGRQLIDLDVNGWGYGFTAGLLSEVLEDRLWLGLSYLSPLLTSIGTDVPLEGRPTQPTWLGLSPDPAQPCGPGARGARISNRDEPIRCASARVTRSFPHLVYFGARLRFDLERGRAAEAALAEAGQRTKSALRPDSVELTGWLRLTIPTRSDLLISLDDSVFPPGELRVPTGLTTALAIALGVRQHFRWLSLAQEILYESPRSTAEAVSPMTLEGHKLDLSLAARLRLHRRLALQLTVGNTFALFESGSGAGYSNDWGQSCRASGYDITSPACQRLQAGWALPAATGSYQLFLPHGIAGLELNL